MKYIFSMLILVLICVSIRSQSAIEVGGALSLNRSDQFLFFTGPTYMNNYFTGVNPYITYSFTTKKSIVYGAHLSAYNMGTYFDIDEVPLSNLRKVKPLLLFQDQIIDFGVQTGYKFESDNSKLSFTPSMGFNMFLPNYHRDGAPTNEALAYEELDNASSTYYDYVSYFVIRNGEPWVAFGYSLLLDFSYALNQNFAITFGAEFKNSFMTLVKYDLVYAFGEREDNLPNLEDGNTGSLSNDNARYGIRLGLKYTFI